MEAQEAVCELENVVPVQKDLRLMDRADPVDDNLNHACKVPTANERGVGTYVLPVGR